MKVIVSVLIAVVPLISITGCATMPPGMLLVYNDSEVKDCRALGTVTSGALYDSSASQALNHIATQASNLGGDTLLVLGQDKGQTASISANQYYGSGFSVTEYSAVGTAYDCSALKIGTAP